MVNGEKFQSHAVNLTLIGQCPMSNSSELFSYTTICLNFKSIKPLKPVRLELCHFRCTFYFRHCQFGLYSVFGKSILTLQKKKSLLKRQDYICSIRNFRKTHKINFVMTYFFNLGRKIKNVRSVCPKHREKIQGKNVIITEFTFHVELTFSKNDCVNIIRRTS